MARTSLAAAESGALANGAGYSDYVNPQWVRLLGLLEMNVRYKRCVGAELFTVHDRRILDFLSGYCVHNLGHNHPRVVAALHDELDRICSGRALTVLFVTHNVREAVRLGDRVIVLSSRPGRVIAEYDVPIERPRRIDSAPVAELAARVTDRLREEMSRDAG